MFDEALEDVAPWNPKFRGSVQINHNCVENPIRGHPFFSRGIPYYSALTIQEIYILRIADILGIAGGIQHDRPTIPGFLR